MGRKNHFISENKIHQILGMYGGKKHFHLFEPFTTYQEIFYRGSLHDGISILLKAGEEEQAIEVHISDSSGRVIRIDYWVFNKDKNLIFDYTEKKKEITYMNRPPKVRPKI